MPIEVESQIIGYLRTNPGSPARAIGRALGIDKSVANSCLYRMLNRGQVVRDDDGNPPYWFLGGGGESAVPSPTPAGELQLDPQASSGGAPLRRWQRDAVKNWAQNDGTGIIQAVTGAGKTRVAIHLMTTMVPRGVRAAVIVPTIPLLNQWWSEIARAFPDVKLGKLGDGSYDSLVDHDILVATLKSASTTYLVLPAGTRGLLVADECHRAAAPTFARSLETEFELRLGLTATLRRDDGAHQTVLEPYFGKVVFAYDYRDASRDGVIAPFRIATVGASFAADERREYDQLSETVRAARRELVHHHGVTPEPYADFIREVNELAKTGTRREGMTASRYLSAASSRRQVLAECDAKYDALGTLAPAIAASSGTLVFAQTIDGAERAAEILRRAGIDASAIHSKTHPDRRVDELDRFRRREIQALVAPVILDEGIDIPEADLAVILATSAQERQMIQRSGRVLRLKADGRRARFVLLFIEDTVEDPNTGAHESFLAQLYDIADEMRRFDAASPGDELVDFLAPR